ncbi:MAG TPA: hypothetical protein VFC52_03800 [Solirubrobacterales bacterium]|nr:hypothetical protein [Solirubrobacterales bacterium]
MKQIRKRLTYANVMSSLAVFLVLGGGAAVAARSSLPGNSVGPRQLQPRAVKTGYIDRNAVRTGKIALEAVRAGKLAKNAVPTNRLRNNAVATAKIANFAVTTPKLRNANVTTEKIRGIAVTGDKIAPGVVDTGKLADAAVTRQKIADASVWAEQLGPVAIRTDTEEIEKESAGEVEVSCKDDERLLSGGGGFDADPAQKDLHLNSSMNVDDDTWRVRGYNDSLVAEDLTARIICLGD